jgi:hypothetical protein
MFFEASPGEVEGQEQLTAALGVEHRFEPRLDGPRWLCGR